MTPNRIILLSIDSLRYDHFTREYFPRCWERFESEFIRFERAISPGVATPFALPGIVTGTLPVTDGTIDAERSISHAFDHAAALTNNPHLGPERGYDTGFDRFSTGPPSSKRTIEETIQWARDVIDDSGLYWIHVMEPHFPFDVPKEVNDRFIDGTATPAECEQLRDAYAEAVRKTDRELAMLFDTIEFDDAMVVFVSDHGEAFGENGVFNHAWDAKPIEELVHVPLAVSVPKYNGGTKDHLVSTQQVGNAIRDRSIEALSIEPESVRSYSNQWTRIKTADRTTFYNESPFDIDELSDNHSRSVIDQLQALGYR